MTLKACSVCGRIAEPGSTRCAAHPKPAPTRGRRAYRRAALAVVSEAGAVCWICGDPPTEKDPLVADHIAPHIFGGRDDPSNLRPAHRSCNARRGAAIVNGGNAA